MPFCLSPNLIRIFLFSLVFKLISGSCLVFAVGSSQKESVELDLLVLNSSMCSGELGERYSSQLRKTLGSEMEIVFEDVSGGRFSSDEYASDYLEFFKRKYTSSSSYGRVPEYMICVGLEAQEFAVRNEALFTNIPTVFSGIQPPLVLFRKIKENDRVAGVFGFNDLRRNVEIASKLHPDRKRIIIIFRSIVKNKGLSRILQNRLASLGVDQDIILYDMVSHSLDEMYTMLAEHEKDSVLIFNRVKNRSDRNHVTNTQILEKISRDFHLPVYGGYRVYLDHGIIGGYLVSVGKLATSTAEVLKEMMTGEISSDLLSGKNIQNSLILDYEQLDRWGVDLDLLPDDAELINRRSSVWEDYRSFVVSVILVLLFLFFLCLLLINQSVHKNRIDKLQTAAEHSLMIKNSELEHELKRSNMLTTELTRANRIKTSFLSVISHELRTPLNPIVTFSQMLIDEIKNQEHLDITKEIRKSSLHLLKLIDGLIEYCRYDSGEISVSKDQIEIKSLVENAVKPYQSQIRAKSLELQFEFNNEDAVIYSDKERLEKLLDVLVSNAVKFTDKGFLNIFAGIDLDVESSFLSIRVSDSGIGISDDIIDSIFAPFFQADAGISRKYQGIGIGLALARGIINSMGGDISCYPNVGAGVCFEVKLPVYLQSEERV